MILLGTSKWKRVLASILIYVMMVGCRVDEDDVSSLIHVMMRRESTEEKRSVSLR